MLSQHQSLLSREPVPAAAATSAGVISVTCKALGIKGKLSSLGGVQRQFQAFRAQGEAGKLDILWHKLKGIWQQTPSSATRC